jgi:hypothetical protein
MSDNETFSKLKYGIPLKKNRKIIYINSNNDNILYEYISAIISFDDDEQVRIEYLFKILPSQNNNEYVNIDYYTFEKDSLPPAIMAQIQLNEDNDQL